MLVNHKITYDSVMKRHLSTRFERARGNTPPFYRSPVSLKLPMMLLCKGTCAPLAPPFKGQGSQCPRHAPPFRRPRVIVSAIMITFLYLHASGIHQHTFNRNRVATLL